MSDVLLMEIFERSCDLLEDAFAGILWKFVVGLLFDGVTKRYARQILHYDIHVIVCLNNVNDFYNIWVGDHLQDLYLPSHGLLPLRVADLYLFVCLNSDFLVLGLEDGYPNRRVCAFADHLAHHVVLLELHGQVRGVGKRLAVFLEAAGEGESGEHLVVLVLELEEPNGCVVPADGGEAMPQLGDCLGLQFDFFFGFAEELIEILFGHQVAQLGLGPHASGSIFGKLARAVLPGGV